MIKHQYRMSDLHTIKDLTSYSLASIICSKTRSKKATALTVFPNKYSQMDGINNL